MSQTVVNRDFDKAFAGMKADARLDTVESFLAQNALDFGLGLVSGDDVDRQVRVPQLNKTILSIDADLVASNSTITTVNSNATPAEVFDTDHETSMANIATAIALLAGVKSATYTGTGRDITIVGNNVAVTASAVTTAGASQGTWTQVQSSNDVFRGISIHEHVEKTLVTGIAKHNVNDAVSTLRKGRIHVTVAVTVKTDEAAFVNVQTAAKEGQFTNVSSGNIATGGKFRSAGTAAGLAEVEIDLPQ